MEEKLKEFDERFYSLGKIEIFQYQDGTATQEFVSYESGVREFIKQALQEQEERIKQEMKEKLMQIVVEDVPHQYQERLLKELNI